MRARYPDLQGYVDSHGVPIYYEVHGEGERTVLFIPPWQIVDSRIYKGQIPYFARFFRVVIFDPRGNGRSGRAITGYDHGQRVADVLAVMDATGTASASVIGQSRSAWEALILAAEYPQKVERIVLSSGAFDFAPPPGFHEPRGSYEGAEKFNAHYWHQDYQGFLEFFFGALIFIEPHSSKQREDGVAWALGTTPDSLIASVDQWGARDLADLLARVHVPTLIVHGTDDPICPIAAAERVHAAIPGSRFVRFEGSGHWPGGRDPVRFNLALREFLQPTPPPQRPWRRARLRPKRALFISSPIGLGHALRDVAVARELRALRPDLEIQWLAQEPVTRMLEAKGEMVHPASRSLAGESAHIESEANEHELQVFYAWRNMDEIFLANFMVLQELLDAEPYDLVIGDEAWEVDYYLHENPELKRCPFVWLSDLVGWLPVNVDPESREAVLAADYNAEMIEQIGRFPRVRDGALFVGNLDDIVDVDFGPGLPRIRDWAERHFSFPGYILPFDPAHFADRRGLRDRLGFRPDEQVVLATVGGTGVGHHLLRKVLAALPITKHLVPGLRLIVVTGPRIDPASLPRVDGAEYHRFIPDLYAHLAGCDLAVVQGGLSTCMELTATRRPFIYFPLRNHFEQSILVPHRLSRYAAGTRMDYHDTTPEALAHAIAEGLKRPVLYRDVETGGATRAATVIARLV